MTKSQRTEVIVTCKGWQDITDTFNTFASVGDNITHYAKHERALHRLLDLFANPPRDEKPLVLDLRQHYQPTKKQSLSSKTVDDNANQGVRKGLHGKQKNIGELLDNLPTLKTLPNYISHLNTLLECYFEEVGKNQEDENDEHFYIQLRRVSMKLSGPVHEAFEKCFNCSVNNLAEEYSTEGIPIWLPVWTPAQKLDCAHLASKIHSRLTAHSSLHTFRKDLLCQLLTDTLEKVNGILKYDYKRTLGRQYQYLQDTKALFARADSVRAVSIDRISTFWLPKSLSKM